MSVSSVAASKAVLHASKHPWSIVVGFLIAKKATSTVEIIDAVPLFHTPILAAATEAALLLSEQHAKSLEGRIAGLYFAHEQQQGEQAGSEMPPVVRKLAALIALRMHASDPKQSKCMVLALKSSLLADESAPSPFVAYGPKGSDWEKLAEQPKLEEGTQAKLTERLLKGEAESLVDFDDALQDASKDWRNPQIRA